MHVVGAAPLRGPIWFEELIESLHSLDRSPYRCPLAREARKAKREIRCLLFGKRRDVYRILYEVDEAKRAVWVLHIRHGARRDLKARDLASPPDPNES
jgi:mRNA-degrading endonuclease RelE of RelBE toxin-antitoxin system